MSAEQDQRLESVRAHHYTVEAQADVLRLLKTAFGQEWGDGALWRWKHCTRPGFSPCDVLIYTSGDTAIGCWHMASHSLRFAPGLEVLSSFEGDYALDPTWRGIGIRRKDQATGQELRALAQRGVVARFAFTSQALYERLYRSKLGWRRVPTVTSRYRKLLNDRAIRSRLQAAGARLLQVRFMQRLVRSKPLVIQVEVRGFSSCSLVIESSAAVCREAVLPIPDLILRIPYAALTIARDRRIFSFLVLVRAFLSGQVGARGLTRFSLRCLSSVFIVGN
ncbi:MAG: hypothetical protein WAN26_04255 [Steroidobacteraceae bacterium]